MRERLKKRAKLQHTSFSTIWTKLVTPWSKQFSPNKTRTNSKTAINREHSNLKRTRPTTCCKLIMSAVRKYLPLDKVSGEKVGRNLHQSGGGKIQVKISRQIPRVEAEPVIHHAGHTPLKYKEVIFRRVLIYTCYAMIWYELFQRNRISGVTGVEKTADH